jgi:cation diffusion facilitator family transporter
MKAASYLKISIAAAVATILLKMAAWWLTGSVGYLSDGLESFVNLAGATFALYMVTLAAMPPDANHPFGHGKAEYFSAGFEGVLIFAAAVAIIVTSVERLLVPVPLGNFGLGTTLSVLSTLINFFVARLLMKASRQLHSLALEADARHLMTDVWTTVGVIGGVGLAMLTEAWWLDPVVAIAVALNILREGGGLVRRAVDGLMDKSLPQAEQETLLVILKRYEADGCEFGTLLTRSAGAQRFAHIDVHVSGTMSVRDAHDLVDRIEHTVLNETGIVLTTHIEPQEQS